MPPVIAVAGKGGSGKTTLSALILRALLDKGSKPLLAVDADPNCNFGEALGVEVAQTLGGTVEQFQEQRAQVPPGMTKESVIEMRFNSVIEERIGFDVLAMGRGEGPGCYCSINNLLRLLVEKLTSSYEFIVIDNEAGLEHLSRRTARKIDMLFVVSDFAVRGVRAAARVAALVDELDLNVSNRMLVLCRAPAEAVDDPAMVEALLEKAGGIDVELGGVVPHDEALVEADLNQTSVWDLDEESISVQATRALLDKVLEKIGAS